MGSYLSTSSSQYQESPRMSVKLENSDVRISHHCSDGELKTWIYDAKTVYEAFKEGERVSNDGPFLGRRLTSDGPYEWLSYSEVSAMSDAFGSGLINECGVVADNSTFIGIFAQNRVEWIVCDQATARFSMALVPLYSSLGKEGCNHILEETELTVLVCENEKKVESILESSDDLKYLRHIVVMETLSEEIKGRVKERKIELHSFEKLLDSGKSKPQTLHPATPDDVCTIRYTSGTTGKPKGVVITHKSLMINVHSTSYAMEELDGKFTPDDVFISYLPLAHVFEKLNMVVCELAGSKAGFFSGNLLNLINDIQTLRPTIFPAVPRLLYRIYDQIYNTARASYIKSALLDRAVSSKTAALQQGNLRSDTWWDTLIFSKVRELFGGRVRHMGSGGAPTSPQVLNFFRIALSCTLINGYGQTELSGASCVSHPHNWIFNHVGGPICCNMVKLVDVPELGYYQESGFGEICVKGENTFREYFKQPEKTKETIDEDGWVHTGDVGTWTADGNLQIIDRCKQIFKLAQGEYIAPEKIEGVYTRCPHVSQVYVDGYSEQSYLVAIVVPDFVALKNTLSFDGAGSSPSELCKNLEIIKMILDEMSATGRANGLKGFEMAKQVFLSPEPFTPENGLLTVTLKSRRNELRKRFKQQIDDLYEKS